MNPGGTRFEADEAADQQPSADQQDQRKRQFGNHQQAAQPVPRQIQTAIALSAAAAGFERGVQIHFHGAPGRREAEQHAGGQRNAERKRQHRAVDADILQARDIAGIHGAHDHKAGRGNDQSGGAAEDRQQNALGQQLPHQPLPARTQRGADGDFLFASRRARQQQVGHVGAGDQQDQRDRAEQHQQRAAHVAHHLLLQADHVHAEAGAALVFDADAAGDDVDIGLRLLHGDARLEADEDVVVFVAAALCRVRAQRQRQKDVHLVHRPFRGHDLGVEQKAALEHARHSEWVSVEGDALADDGGIGVEQPLPGAVAENGDSRSARLVLLRQQRAARAAAWRRTWQGGWTAC